VWLLWTSGQGILCGVGQRGVVRGAQCGCCGQVDREYYLELDSVGLCGCCGQVDREYCVELDSVGL